MSETPTMVPVKCGMCRSSDASGMIRLNDETVFICAACLVLVERAAWRRYVPSAP